MHILYSYLSHGVLQIVTRGRCSCHNLCALITLQHVVEYVVHVFFERASYFKRSVQICESALFKSGPSILCMVSLIIQILGN